MLAKDHYSDSGQMIVNRGERIYRDLYQYEYESQFGGQYVVIEVLTKRAYVSDTAAGAIRKAKTDDPDGLFHIVKIRGQLPKGIKSFFRELLDYVLKR